MKIDKFKHEKYNEISMIIDTLNGPENAVLKEWSNDNEKIQYWFIISDDEDGWGIIYGSDTNKKLACKSSIDTDILIMGVYFGHSFVTTSSFVFENSDGSIFDEINPSITIENVKQLMKNKTIEYLFNQIH